MIRARAPHQVADDETLVVRCFVAMLFASIFLQRFALPVGGIALNLAVTMGLLGLLLLRGVFVLDALRAGLFLLLTAAICLSVAVNADRSSIASAALMVVMYAPFVLTLREPGRVLRRCVAAFQIMVLICAVLGIAQFALQFVIGPDYLFTFKGLIPGRLLLEGFNTANPLRWDSPYFKSNGFFMIEPSTFSQYLAVAILLELLFRGASWRLLVYGLALPTSYSGTGLIVLAVMLPPLLLHLRAYRVIIGGLVFLFLAVLTGGLWNIDALLDRAAEFQSPDSSANARFTAGAWLISDFQLWSLSDVIFGLGSGSFLQLARQVSYEAHDAAWAKIFFEYGLLGSLAFWALFLVALYRRAASNWVVTALLIGYLTFGGMVLDPRMQLLLLVFAVLVKAPGLPVATPLSLSLARRPSRQMPQPGFGGLQHP